MPRNTATEDSELSGQGPPAAPPPQAPFERLLVPVDFSAASRAAFATAMRLATHHGSEVVLFNATGFSENNSFLNALGAPWGRDDAIEEATNQLRDFAETVCPDSAVRVRFDATREDDPVQAIARAVQRHGATLAVLGAEERTRVLRSTAERIEHAVECSVLLVRAG